MKLSLSFVIIILVLMASCNNSSKKETIEVESAKWTLEKIYVLDTATSRFVPYFQQSDTAGNSGSVELKDYGVRGQQLRIYDGKGNLIIDSEILSEEPYKGGFEARTTFFDKPNKVKSMELVQKNGDREITKQNTVFDPIVKVHGVIRFIPDLNASKTLNLIGVQFDIPKMKESVYVKFY